MLVRMYVLKAPQRGFQAFHVCDKSQAMEPKGLSRSRPKGQRCFLFFGNVEQYLTGGARYRAELLESFRYARRAAGGRSSRFTHAVGHNSRPSEQQCKLIDHYFWRNLSLEGHLARSSDLCWMGQVKESKEGREQWLTINLGTMALVAATPKFWPCGWCWRDLKLLGEWKSHCNDVDAMPLEAATSLGIYIG